MYKLEVYQQLPGIGWVGVNSVDLGHDRHAALTSPLIEEVVKATEERTDWRTYYTITRTN